MLKYGGEETTKQLKHLNRNIWESEQVPEDWKMGTIIPLPKKGDLTNCSNWRGITLLSLSSKVLCIVILNRIKDQVDARLRDEQSGFRKYRSCTDAIFTLRNIIEKSLELQNPVYLHFVDFQKAFDSIHRETMWKIVKFYGVPEKIIRVLQSLYDNTQCCVRTDEGTTEPFKIETGVRQGCVISPFLFIMVIDYLLNQIEGKGYGIDIGGERKLFNLDFADDIALIDSTNEGLQNCTHDLKEGAAKVGLRFNVKKCEVMTTDCNEPEVFIDAEQVKNTEDFTYLGSKLCTDVLSNLKFQYV